MSKNRWNLSPANRLLGFQKAGAVLALLALPLLSQAKQFDLTLNNVTYNNSGIPGFELAAPANNNRAYCTHVLAGSSQPQWTTPLVSHAQSVQPVTLLPVMDGQSNLTCQVQSEANPSVSMTFTVSYDQNANGHQNAICFMTTQCQFMSLGVYNESTTAYSLGVFYTLPPHSCYQAKPYCFPTV